MASRQLICFLIAMLLLPQSGSSEPAKRKIKDKLENFPCELEVVASYVGRFNQKEEEAERIAQAIIVESERHDIMCPELLAIIKVESKFNPKAQSHREAQGLMQLIPDTQRFVIRAANLEQFVSENGGEKCAFNVECNLRLGVWYYGYLRKFFRGNRRLAVAAFFWGPGEIQRRVKEGEPLPVKYGKLVEKALHHVAGFADDL